MDMALEQAISLSSGTLATLSGRRSYEELDDIQAEFVGFIAEREGRYHNWMAAWEDYKQLL